MLPLPPRRSDLPLGSGCDRPCCLRAKAERSASGVYFLSGPPLGSLALRPGDSLTIPSMALSIGFTSFVSSTRAIQATGLLTLTPVGLTPTENASLCWTHCLLFIPSALPFLHLADFSEAGLHPDRMSNFSLEYHALASVPPTPVESPPRFGYVRADGASCGGR